jgi:hypothetical protein
MITRTCEAQSNSSAVSLPRRRICAPLHSQNVWGKL